MGARKRPKLKTWSQFKQERFKNNHDEAFEYLRVSLEENADMPEVIIEAIRSVYESLVMPDEHQRTTSVTNIKPKTSTPIKG